MTRSPTGLYYRTLREGRGTEVAAAGDSLLVDYTGWTRNGRRFDSSEGRGRPLPVVLGDGDVIPGFEEGLEGMRLGEERLLVIPHELAYGSRRIGDIPPYAILVFRIELVGLEKAQASLGNEHECTLHIPRPQAVERLVRELERKRLGGRLHRNLRGEF